MSTRTAILLLALLTTPAWGADYEPQSAAVAVCQQKDVDNNPHVFFKCMTDAGFEFCRDCERFGFMLGGTCSPTVQTMDFPACWYRVGEIPQSHLAIVMARWRRWVQDRGWEKQGGAPFYPDDYHYDPRKLENGRRDWMKHPLTDDESACASEHRGEVPNTLLHDWVPPARCEHDWH